MKERVDVLLDRYWAGESSLKEEKELRNLLFDSEGYETEKVFFLGISDLSELKEDTLKHPANRRNRTVSFWLRVAAGFLIFLISGVSIYLHQKRLAEKEAYEQVLQAFAMIQENMHKGTDNLQVLQEFHHLKTPNEIFDIENE